MAEVDEIKALNDTVVKYAEAVTAAQSKNTELESIVNKSTTEIEALKASSDVIKEASKASADAMQAVNDMKIKLEAIDKTSQYIEKAMSRMGEGGGDGEAKEMEFKAADQMARYLRSGREMDDDVKEAIVGALHEKAFFGVEESQKDNEIKTLLAGSNPDGGYFIRPERSATMIKRIFETSPMRSYANIESTGGDTLEFIIDDDEAASGGWVGEVDGRPETGTPKIGKLVIPVHEQYAEPRATQKMLDDAGFDIESWLSGKVTRKMTREENSAFVVGDGSQKPRGVLDYAAWAVAGEYQRNALEVINSGTSAEFTADGLKALQNALIEDYQGSAIFAMKRASFLPITTLKDTQDQYLLDPRSLKLGDTEILLGKNVVFFNDVPGVAADARACIYGDFGTGYTIVDRIGFRVIRDNVTSKPYVKFYTTKRTGGDVTNYEALKIQALSA